MKRLILSIFMLCAAALGACATPSDTPQQVVFAAKEGYATALTAAVAYKHLPVCTDAVKAPCSKPEIVRQLQKADTVASGALDAAETAVRTPGFGTNLVSSAIAAASAAVGAFTSILGSK